jgi:hypothetical protein
MVDPDPPRSDVAGLCMALSPVIPGPDVARIDLQTALDPLETLVARRLCLVGASELLENHAEQSEGLIVVEPKLGGLLHIRSRFFHPAGRE